MSGAQAEVVRRLRNGDVLNWFGDNGPEFGDTPFRPSKRTVRAMLKAGVLKWGEYRNSTQREAGICPIVLTRGSP